MKLDVPPLLYRHVRPFGVMDATGESDTLPLTLLHSMSSMPLRLNHYVLSDGLPHHQSHFPSAPSPHADQGLPFS